MTHTVSVMSDLHLEFEDFKPPGGDILVLAGDICTARHLKTEGELGQRYRDFFEHCAANYNHVLYVPGNHESYGYNLSDTLGTLSANITSRIEMGDCQDYYLIDDWVFLLTTLWTDCNKGDPTTYLMMSERLNDFRTIRYGANYQRLTPQLTHKIHNDNLNWLENQLEDNKDWKVFVVTHHGPHPQSIHSKYALEHHMNGAYVSDLSHLFDKYSNLKYWAHGHVHNSFDYRAGSGRVITNPKGYYNENKSFNPHFTVTLNV